MSEGRYEKGFHFRSLQSAITSRPPVIPPGGPGNVIESKRLATEKVDHQGLTDTREPICQIRNPVPREETRNLDPRKCAPSAGAVWAPASVMGALLGSASCTTVFRGVGAIWAQKGPKFFICLTPWFLVVCSPAHQIDSLRGAREQTRHSGSKYFDPQNAERPSAQP